MRWIMDALMNFNQTPTQVTKLYNCYEEKNPFCQNGLKSNKLYI